MSVGIWKEESGISIGRDEGIRRLLSAIFEILGLEDGGGSMCVWHWGVFLRSAFLWKYEICLDGRMCVDSTRRQMRYPFFIFSYTCRVRENLPSLQFKIQV